MRRYETHARPSLSALPNKQGRSLTLRPCPLPDHAGNTGFSVISFPW
ncbi:hypothetical protein HMPREF3038_02030 [Akkermansia sp. KLE1797]|nr:hypothetical protein HMPREF3038_02030 [Akkermansia sp. KLE1797]KXU54752.1 hypothetical protein HMPREF3039_01225 [Akkermansia sp. KLE1798]KZA06095.1 hypothetical protein HMPREF1326_00359 [Akkermansia sp. KLE1605]